MNARLLALTPLVVAGCALPERRPDAELVVESCDSDVELATNVSNMDCLRLDARPSSGSGLTFRWEWSRDDESWTTIDPSTHIGTRASCPPQVAPNREQICARPFEGLIDGDTRVTLRLLATDSSGHDGSDERVLRVARIAPIIRAVPKAYRGRSVDMVLNPFIVVEPEIRNANAADYHVRVIWLGPEGKELRGSLCSELLARTGYQDDPSGRLNAWCFDVFPFDDVRTPAVDESQTYTYVPFLDPESVEFVFRIDAVEPSLANDALPLETDPCIPRTGSAESATCVTSVFTDVVWTAAGQQLSGRVGRYAADWARVPMPPTAGIRDGVGMANHGPRTWFAGSFYSPACSFTSCEGILDGLSAGLDQDFITGLGLVRQIESGPGYLVVDHLVSANPRGTPAAVVTSGDHHVFSIPDAGLVPRDLVAMPAPDLSHLVGFGSYSFPGGQITISPGQEVPTDILPTANGDLWLLTLAGPAQDLRVRRVTPADVATGIADIRNIPPLVLDPPVGSPIAPVIYLPFPAIARTATGIVYVERDPVSYNLRVRFLSSTGVETSSFSVDVFTFGIAYDAAADALWVTDIARSSVHRIEGASQLSGMVYADLDPAVDSAGPVTFPGSLAIDQYGGLWVDDRIDSFARRPIYIGPPRANGELPAPIALDDYPSSGIGILASREVARGAWRPDLLDIVRAPLFSPEEIPVSAVLPAQPKLVGVDTLDGSAYFVATVAGPNFFRVDAQGVVHELGSLPGLPLGGALIPDLSRLIVPDAGTGVRRGSVFVGVTEPGPVNSILEIPLAPLRRLEPGETIPSPLPDCPVPFPDGAPACRKARLTMPSGLAPAELVFSPVQASIFVYSAYGDAQELGSIVLGDLLDEANTVYVGPRALSLTGGIAIQDSGRVLSSVIGGEGDGFYGGVLVRMPDDTATLWAFDDAAQVAPVPGYKVASPLPGAEIRAARVDALTNGLWLALDDGTPGATLIWRATASFTTGSGLVITSAATIAVTHEVDGADVAPFSDALWTVGLDGWVTRIHHLPDNTLLVEYSRPPDFIGSLGPTPSGSHVYAGSL